MVSPSPSWLINGFYFKIATESNHHERKRKRPCFLYETQIAAKPMVKSLKCMDCMYKEMVMIWWVIIGREINKLNDKRVDKGAKKEIPSNEYTNAGVIFCIECRGHGLMRPRQASERANDEAGSVNQWAWIWFGRLFSNDYLPALPWFIIIHKRIRDLRQSTPLEMCVDDDH